MTGEFFIGDRLGTKGNLSMNMNIFFMGAEEKEDDIWSVNLGYGNSVGQGGFGLNSLLSVKKGESVRFSSGFKTAFTNISHDKPGKKIKCSFSVMTFRDIQKDRIVVEFKDAEESSMVNSY